MNKCVSCGGGPVKRETRATSFTYWGRLFYYEQPGEWCAQCGEVFLDKNDRDATDPLILRFMQKLSVEKIEGFETRIESIERKLTATLPFMENKKESLDARIERLEEEVKKALVPLYEEVSKQDLNERLIQLEEAYSRLSVVAFAELYNQNTETSARVTKLEDENLTQRVFKLEKLLADHAMKELLARYQHEPVEAAKVERVWKDKTHE